MYIYTYDEDTATTRVNPRSRVNLESAPQVERALCLCAPKRADTMSWSWSSFVLDKSLYIKRDDARALESAPIVERTLNLCAQKKADTMSWAWG